VTWTTSAPRPIPPHAAHRTSGRRNDTSYSIDRYERRMKRSRQRWNS
jgi:hypothetical protein